MVTTLNSRPAAREAGYEMMQYIATRIQADPGGAVVNVRIGTLPAGALITQIISRIATAITGGTPAITIGSLGDVGLDNVVLAMAEAAGSEALLPLAAFVMPLAADTEIFASISGGSTAGDAYIVVQFVKPLA